MCLAWKDIVIVSLNNFSLNHIDVEVIKSNDDRRWRLTGF